MCAKTMYYHSSLVFVHNFCVCESSLSSCVIQIRQATSFTYVKGYACGERVCGHCKQLGYTIVTYMIRNDVMWCSGVSSYDDSESVFFLQNGQCPLHSPCNS